jgi:hypothetical protein
MSLARNRHGIDDGARRSRRRRLLQALARASRLRSLFASGAPRVRELGEPLDEGFHGDQYLLRLVAWLATQVGAFIETGSNVGTTARYVADTYPALQVYSCECDDAAFQIARRHLEARPNARAFHEMSPKFLYDLHDEKPELRSQLNLYWLDAHGYGFAWPLADEVAFLTSTLDRAFVLIDDFRVPGRPDFSFDRYGDQVCCFEAIEPAIQSGRTYRLVYPRYTEHTSRHHPLVGVGLLEFGVGEFALPEGLSENFSVRTITR